MIQMDNEPKVNRLVNHALPEEILLYIKNNHSISQALAQLPPIAQCTNKGCQRCSHPYQPRKNINYNLRY